MVAKMCHLVLQLILVFRIKVTAGGHGPEIGPFEIEFERMLRCEDEGSRKWVFGTRISYAGKGKYVYNENFTLGVPADEHTKATIEVQKWGNGGWRKKSFQYTIKSCQQFWDFIGDQVLEMMTFTNINVTKCPIPAGVYKVDNWPIALNIEKWVPVIEYGKYRGIMKFYSKEEFVGCITGIMSVVPKT